MHVLGVKFGVLRVGKIRLDKGQIVVDAIVLRLCINAQKVIVTDVVNHRGDSSAADVQKSPVDRCPVRIEPAVADDIRVAIAREFRGPQVRSHPDAGRIKKGLGYHSAVDIHLLVAVSVGLNLNHHRRERAGYGGGGEYYRANYFQGAGPTTGRDRTDVPDDRPLGVQTGSADQQKTAFVVLGCDVGKRPLVDVMGNQAIEWRRISQRFTEYGVVNSAPLQDIIGSNLGVHGAQAAHI